MKKQTVVSFVIFVISVIIFTRLDYLINADFYSYGLQFSWGWYQTYGIIYALLFQLVMFLLLLYNRSFPLFVVFEAFVLSCSQDFIFFGVWNRGVFPSGDWWWMPFYGWFGHWTTLDQILLSIIAITLSIVVIKIWRTFSFMVR